MKTFHNTINFTVATFGVLLLKELFTYGTPIPVGCIWIGLVSIKSILDMTNN